MKSAAAIALFVLLGAAACTVDAAKGPLSVDLKIKKILNIGDCTEGALDASFQGEFSITKKFIKHNDGLAAVGIITGVLTKNGKKVLVSIPDVIYPVSALKTKGAKKSRGLLQFGACPVLDLVLGPLSLDLLGLQVDLAKVVLDITAQSGAGNLLGNLVCAIANLLNGSSLAAQLDNVLNTLNDILGNLLPSLG